MRYIYILYIYIIYISFSLSIALSESSSNMCLLFSLQVFSVNLKGSHRMSQGPGAPGAKQLLAAVSTSETG